jgi:transcriptional regulator with XRE-family HTH domain
MVAAITDEPQWGWEVLKALRELLGLSQAKLAEEVGCHERLISYYETGKKRPPRERIEELATYFEQQAERPDYRSKRSVIREKVQALRQASWSEGSGRTVSFRGPAPPTTVPDSSMQFILDKRRIWEWNWYHPISVHLAIERLVLVPIVIAVICGVVVAAGVPAAIGRGLGAMSPQPQAAGSSGSSPAENHLQLTLSAGRAYQDTANYSKLQRGDIAISFSDLPSAVRVQAWGCGGTPLGPLYTIDTPGEWKQLNGYGPVEAPGCFRIRVHRGSNDPEPLVLQADLNYY